MSLREIAQIVAASLQTGQTESEIFIAAIIDTILEGLQKDRQVKLKGFGTFKLTSVRERESINVNTGERIVISEHDKITFTPDNVMRDIINKPFAQFETVILSDGVVFEDTEIENETDDNDGVVDAPTDSVSSIISPANTSLQQKEEAVTQNEDEAKIVTPLTQTVEDEKFQKTEHVDCQPTIQETTDKHYAITQDMPTDSEEENTEGKDEDFTSTPATISIPKSENINNHDEHIVLNCEESEAGIDNDNDTSEYNNNKIEKRHKHSSDSNLMCVVATVLLTILIICLSFSLGYIASMQKWFVADCSDNDTNITVVDKVKNDNVQPLPTSAHTTESSNTIDSAKTEKVETADKTEEEKKATSISAQNSETIKNNVSKDSIEIFKSDDPRVRTGAYNIIGIEKIVTVSQGQTITSISNSHLGKGMECYVEAINGGIKEITQGQKIKIPKLQLKKRK